MKQDGLSVTKWGYFNDVLTGPFVPYGIETEKKELIEKSNDQHKHASSELAEYNIQSYMEEYKKTFPSSASLTSRVKIHILPAVADPFAALHKHSRSTKLRHFTSIFLSNSSAQFLQKIPPTFLTQNTRVYVETARFMLDLKEDFIKAFDEKVVELAKGVGLHLLGKPGEKGK
ncbi:Dynein assembly factor 3, axonemal, partial [Rhizoclosmatium hyalinum]